MNLDNCPECNSNIARQAYEAEKFAGDVFTCPFCDTDLQIVEWNNGWERRYIFIRLNSK